VVAFRHVVSLGRCFVGDDDGSCAIRCIFIDLGRHQRRCIYKPAYWLHNTEKLQNIMVQSAFAIQSKSNLTTSKCRTCLHACKEPMLSRRFASWLLLATSHTHSCCIDTSYKPRKPVGHRVFTTPDVGTCGKNQRKTFMRTKLTCKSGIASRCQVSIVICGIVVALSI
jgi:hypothetical protein